MCLCFRKCKLKGCIAKRLNNSKWCYIHTCSVDCCNKLVETGEFYCRLHNTPKYF